MTFKEKLEEILLEKAHHQSMVEKSLNEYFFDSCVTVMPMGISECRVCRGPAYIKTGPCLRCSIKIANWLMQQHLETNTLIVLDGYFVDFNEVAIDAYLEVHQ